MNRQTLSVQFICHTKLYKNCDTSSSSLKAGPLTVTEKIKVFTLLALKTGPFTDLCDGFHAFTGLSKLNIKIAK